MNMLEFFFVMYRDVGMRVQGGGVWLVDVLIYFKCKRFFFFIVNILEGNYIGIYWVVFYFFEKGLFEFFDFLGYLFEYYYVYFKFFFLGFGYSWNRVVY